MVKIPSKFSIASYSIENKQHRLSC